MGTPPPIFLKKMRVRDEYKGKQVYLKPVGLLEVTMENFRYFEAFGLVAKYFENDKNSSGTRKRRKGNTKRTDNDKRPNVSLGVQPPTAKDGRSGDNSGHSDSSPEKEI